MPMQLSVRVTDKGVYQGLTKVGEGLPAATAEELGEFMDLVQLEASGGYEGGNTYRDVPTRGYERTGNYGRSFVVEKTGLTYRLSNATYTTKGKEYGVLVGGRADGTGQAWMHVGFWPVIRFVVDKLVNMHLVRRLNDRFGQMFRDAGIGL